MEFVAANWELFAGLVVVLALLAWSYNADSLGGFRNVGTAEAVSLINRSGARVVDLRASDEFNTGHVQDAMHLPYAEMQARADGIDWAAGKPVLMVCSAGQRPAVATRALKKAGVEQVFNLQGGMRAWQDANLPVSTGAAE